MVFFLLAEYVALCKSINRLDFLCFNRELARETALWLNSLKAFFFDFVKSKVCRTIALFKLLTNALMRGDPFNGLPRFFQPMNWLVSMRRYL